MKSPNQKLYSYFSSLESDRISRLLTHFGWEQTSKSALAFPPKDLEHLKLWMHPKHSRLPLSLQADLWSARTFCIQYDPPMVGIMQPLEFYIDRPRRQYEIAKTLAALEGLTLTELVLVSIKTFHPYHADLIDRCSELIKTNLEKP